MDILFLINAILIIFIIYYIYKCINPVNKRKLILNDIYDICGDKTIAVVGNGPLTEEDRHKINKMGCIIRFNSMLNKLKTERVDVLALRGHTFNLSKDTHTIWPVMDIGCDNNTLQELKYDIMINPIYAYGGKGNNTCKWPLKWKSAKHKENYNPDELTTKVLFKNCKQQIKQGDSLAGPSTGVIIIDYLENHKMIKKGNVNIFGMNWNGRKTLVDFKFPNLVKDCCTKCIIHETQSQKYN